jgi:hypothetical protein
MYVLSHKGKDSSLQRSLGKGRGAIIDRNFGRSSPRQPATTCVDVNLPRMHYQAGNPCHLLPVSYRFLTSVSAI